MANERDELLDHDYDGIREYNNPLPGWWLWLFYGSILFAVIYFPYFAAGFGLSSSQEYQEELAMAPKPPAAAAAPAGGAPGAAAAPAMGKSLQGDAAAVAAGKDIFLANCLPCHGAQAQGGIGPNLTDAYWLHGNTYAEIVHTITEGVPAKGMISWKAILNPEKILQVAAFVDSLRGSNPPNPKPPQGEKYPR